MELHTEMEKVHTVPAHRSGPSNSTAKDQDTTPMTTPLSPIMEHHVNMNQSEGSGMEAVKELLEDPKIKPSMMQSALNTVTSLFNLSKTVQPAKEESSGNPHQMPAASTSSHKEMTHINGELKTYKDRLTLDLTNFKKQLETLSGVEVECTKENLKTEFEHVL